MKVLLLFLGLAFASLSFGAQAPISLEVYLQTLIEKDDYFKDLVLSRDIDLKALEANLQRWDINISLGGTQRQNEGEDSFTKNVRLSSDVPETATSVELSYQNNAITSLFTDVTALQLNQRLWNNGFGFAHQAKKRQLNLQAELAALQFMESVEAYLVEAAGDYLDYYHSVATLKIRQRNLQDAKELERNVNQRFRSRIALESDLLQAKVRTMEAQTRLKQTESELELARRTLEDRLADISPGSPVLPRLKVALIDKGELSQLRKVKIAELQQQIAESESDLIRDSLRPATDAYLGVENRQLRGSSSAQDYYYLGFQVEVPVRQSQKRFGFAEQKLQVERQRLQVVLAGKELKTNRDELKSQIHLYQRQLDQRQDILKMLQKVANEEQRRFNQGLIGLREVLTARQSMEDMRLQILQDEIGLQRLLIQWLALNDQLLARVRLVS